MYLCRVSIFQRASHWLRGTLSPRGEQTQTLQEQEDSAAAVGVGPQWHAGHKSGLRQQQWCQGIGSHGHLWLQRSERHDV